MTREIKFRAWNKLSMKMDYSPCLYKPNKEVEDCLLNEWIQMAQEHMNGVILMQFTGLHDKNGKEIWEGDILKGSWTNAPVEIMEWSQDNAGCGCCSHTAGWSIEASDCKNMEVLGNIYENPELLKGDGHEPVS